MKHMASNLRLPAALLLASLLLGASVFNFALNTRMASEARLIAEKGRADQGARALREAPARLIQDRLDAPLYSRILASGFIGEEDRVAWISALAQTQARLRLGSLAWRMTAQMPSPLASGLYVSNMEFTASPLNPSTLSELIGHLRTTANGRFTVERCTLTFDREGSGSQATCSLNWWTLAQHGH